MTEIQPALASFETALAEAKDANQAYNALFALTDAVIGTRLFTIMTVDKDAMLARRAYSSDPENYPTSGTKPFQMDPWFDRVINRRELFVANTLAEIDNVFPDAELIGRLGCGSVINLPVVLGGNVVATANILDKERHYTSEKIEIAARVLRLPSMAAVAWAGNAAAT